jgi:predicted RNA-binding protein with PIN domain
MIAWHSHVSGSIPSASPIHPGHTFHSLGTSMTKSRKPAEHDTSILDGYNVIRRVRELRSVEQQYGLEAGRNALLDRIHSSRLLAGTHVIVIFDGATGISHSGPSLPEIEVRFSTPPQNADRAILTALKSRAVTSHVSVITADRDLEWEARKLGARVIDPEAWIMKFSPLRRGVGEPVNDDPEKPKPDKSGTKHWLEVFGDERIEIAGKSAARPHEGRAVDPSEKDKVKKRRKERYLRRMKRQQ